MTWVTFSARFLMPVCAAALAMGQTGGAVNRVIPGTLRAPYEPIAPRQRLKWFANSSFGPASLTGGVISAGFGTLFNRPAEYGPHWEGFGDRYGIRLTGVLTSNAMEAGLGALWGEDPRYERDAGEAFKHRVGHIVKWTFIARNRNGDTIPAYARYAATAGNNFLANTWRERSEADTTHALERTGWGFLARMSSNAFKEFWPDVRNRLFRPHSSRADRQRSGDSR
jgi:hypothetical protein